MSPRVEVVANEKGGTAKTTTTAALAHLYTRERERVVALDLDPQGSLTQHLLGRADTGQGMLDLLSGRRVIGELLVDIPTLPGARMVPSGKLVERAEGEARLLPAGGHLMLRHALARLGSDVDVVLVDTPPTNKHLLNVALGAADEVLVPCTLESAAVKGLAFLTHTIDQMRVVNPRLRLVGIVPSIVKTRRGKENARVRGYLHGTYGALVFESEVRDSADIPPTDRKAIAPTAHKPSGEAAQDLVRVFHELQARRAGRAA